MKLFLLVLLMMLPMAVSAADVEIDGIFYYVVKKGKHAEVAASDRDHRYKGDIVIPETIEYEGVVCKVEAIQKEAFRDCSDVTSVSLPNTINSIGSRAFNRCGYSKGMTSINIPSGVEVIEPYTFEGCGATTITLSEGLTSIGDHAFDNCDITSMSIPNSVTTMGEFVFKGCENLTSLTIGSGLTTINEYAFNGCGLTSVDIPGTVITIGYRAFANCPNLTSVTIGNGVQTIDDSAFYWCTGLTSVDIPSSVTSICTHAFDNCESLAAITIGNSVTKLGSYAFRKCTSLTEITIPGSVSDIEEETFNSCTNLVSVTLQEGIKTIGSSAFNRCSSLKSIYIPKSVTELNQYAFCRCSKLEYAVIPRGVSRIGWNTFSNCDELTDIYYYFPWVGECSGSSFENSEIGYATLHVAPFLVELYKEADVWEDFGTIVALKEGDPGFVAPTGTAIEFADDVAHILCLRYFDENGDFQVSEEEAAAVKEITEEMFAESNIGSFDELRYFTGLKTIPFGAFDDCEKLLSITIPYGVETIGYTAFNSCSKLKRVTIPATVTNVETWAFPHCDDLTDVYCYALTPPSYGSMAFTYPKGMTLHVPAAAIEKYKAANGWKEFGKIVALDGTDPGYGPSDNVPGDVDGDGFVTAADIVAIVRVMAGYGDNTLRLRADINSDGTVNSADIMEAVKMINE